MKLYLLAILSIISTLTSCGQDLFTVTSKPIGSFNVNNSNFYISVTKVSTGATSSDFMQVRRVYNDSTYEVVNNITDVDSIVEFKHYSDTIKLIVRGRLWDESIKNDTFRFPISNTWTPGRFKIKN